MKKIFFIMFVVGVLVCGPLVAHADLYLDTSDSGSGGEPITLELIEDIVDVLSRFLIRMSEVAAVVSIVVIGIWMMIAKEEEGFKKARSWLWRAMIGALVIFGVGVILNSIKGVWTGDFFGGFF